MGTKVSPVLSPFQQSLEPEILTIRQGDPIRVRKRLLGRIIDREPIVAAQPGQIAGPHRGAGQHRRLFQEPSRRVSLPLRCGVGRRIGQCATRSRRDGGEIFVAFLGHAHLDAVRAARCRPVRFSQQRVAARRRRDCALDHADQPDRVKAHAGRSGKGRYEDALAGGSQMAERSLHQLPDQLPELRQGRTIVYAVCRGELVQKPVDAFPGLAVRLAEVGGQVGVQQAAGPIGELAPGASVGRRLEVSGEFLDECLNVPRDSRLGPHATGTGDADFADGFAPFGIRHLPLGMGGEPVAPLLQVADDARFPGDHVPLAGAETLAGYNGNSQRTTAQPCHHFRSRELAARQTQKAAQSTARPGAG